MHQTVVAESNNAPLICRSHTCNFAHPLSTGVESLDEMPEATEVFMKAGDVLLFTVRPIDLLP